MFFYSLRLLIVVFLQVWSRIRDYLFPVKRFRAGIWGAMNFGAADYFLPIIGLFTNSHALHFVFASKVLYSSGKLLFLRGLFLL